MTPYSEGCEYSLKSHVFLYHTSFDQPTGLPLASKKSASIWGCLFHLLHELSKIIGRKRRPVDREGQNATLWEGEA